MNELIAKSLDAAATLISKGVIEESELICRQVLKLDDSNPDAMCLLSCCLIRSGRAEESEALLKEAEILAGEKADVYNSMGISCMHAREVSKAIKYFDRASELNPQDHDSKFNKASCLMVLGRPKEALSAFRESYANKKTHKSMVGMACAKAEMLDLNGAMDLLDMVMEEDPCNSEARTNMASVLHLLGRWEESWKYYTSRLEHYERLRRNVENLRIPLWKEGEPPKGKILVFSEQGVGDAINFGRMSNFLMKKYPDRDVGVFVSGQLRPLLESQGVRTVESTEGFDACCSMMDIPGLAGMSKEEVANSFVPIRPSKACDMSRFSGMFKVGVCWAGNPAHPKDHQRSCSLNNFRRLSGLDDVKLFSLQKDVRPRMWPDSPEPVDLCSGCEDMRLVNMAPHMNSWEDTAAIIYALDLVISVDTSVMHLSAAMGKETWGLIPYVPDWRWGTESETTCWYPGLRLFRQKRMGDWGGVFSAVSEELKKKLSC